MFREWRLQNIDFLAELFKFFVVDVWLVVGMSDSDYCSFERNRKGETEEKSSSNGTSTVATSNGNDGFHVAL